MALATDSAISQRKQQLAGLNSKVTLSSMAQENAAWRLTPAAPLREIVADLR
jgi:hypothetical protein